MTAPLRIPWARPVLAVREGPIGLELVARLGTPTAWAHLLALHAWAFVHRPTGDLRALPPAAVARAADWPGNPDALWDALVQSGAVVDGKLVPLDLPTAGAVRVQRLRARRNACNATTVTVSGRCLNDLCARPISLLVGEPRRLCVVCEGAPREEATLPPAELRARIYAFVSAHRSGIGLDEIRRHCAGQSVENIRNAIEHLQGTHRIRKPDATDRDIYQVNPARRRA